MNINMKFASASRQCHANVKVNFPTFDDNLVARISIASCTKKHSAYMRKAPYSDDSDIKMKRLFEINPEFSFPQLHKNAQTKIRQICFYHHVHFFKLIIFCC